MQLSIITINYNNCEGLRKTIESVINQTWKEFEWIIVDGGSTDGSKELIEETAKSCTNISFWCCEPDNGVYNAMNKGITHARGEYMNFMNSGDTFYDEFVLSNVFNEPHYSDVIYGDWIWKQLDGKESLAYCPHDISMAWFQISNICHQAIFVKSSLLIEEGYNEEYKIYADWARWMKLASEGKVFEYVPFIICKYEAEGLSSKCNNELKQMELAMVKNIPPIYIRKVLSVYEDNLIKLKQYENCNLTRDTLLLINERALYCKILHLAIIGTHFIKKILDFLHL